MQANYLDGRTVTHTGLTDEQLAVQLAKVETEGLESLEVRREPPPKDFTQFENRHDRRRAASINGNCAGHKPKKKRKRQKRGGK